VYKPIAEGGRCDLIFDLQCKLVRVQCKWAARRGDVIPVRFYSSRRGPEGFRRRSYTTEEADAIVAYCAEVDRCFFLPMDVFGTRTELQLRLALPRNNQKRGLHWADDFDLVRLDLGRNLEGP